MKAMKSPVCHIVFAILLVFAVSPLGAQVMNSQFMDRMESARKLYINGSYFAAEKAFMSLEQSIAKDDSFNLAEIEAYEVLCAIALDKENVSGMVKVFCDKYPNAPQQGMVKYALGSRFFDTGQYKEALEIFNTIKPDHVYKPNRNDYEFRKAYCNMCVGNLDQAGEGYESIMNGDFSRYTVPSTYYRGYVFYSQKDFANAVPLFEKVEDDSRFEQMSRYYAVESKFMLKDYDYAIEQGEPLFPSLEGDMKINMARILSEAYYERKDNNNAQKYLEMYRNGTDVLSRKDNYFAAMLSYNLGDYTNAVKSFGKVMGEDDELCQNAHYYTANSHLKGRNKVEAMTEFKAAAEMDFDKVIKEDAWFNYAKLSFDVNSDISQFDRYLKEFPNSGKEDIISNYMAASFLLANDYSSAVKALSNVRKPTNESSSNLQKAAFFAAMQMIENKGYRSALEYLRIAAKNESGNAAMNRLVKFWTAECLFRSEDYDEAVELNEALLNESDFRLTSEYPLALYNQGYAYFMKGKYDEAREYFFKYTENGVYAKKMFERDALVRLADTYFLTGNFSEAAYRYEDIYMKDYLTNDVYPALQASRSYGRLGNSAKRISILKMVCRNNKGSHYYPQSLYELGCAYAQYGQNSDASECFFTILGMENDSTYYAKSLLELASINVSAKKYERAEDYYKEILESAPYSPEAQAALGGLENVCQIMNRPEEFLSYIDNLGMSDLKTDQEKESMLFKSAERLYSANRYGPAANALQRFLTQYPSGQYSAKATYLLASCLENTGRLETAADTYHKVIRGGKGEYATLATERLASIAYTLKEYDRAVEAYSALIASEGSPEVKMSASLGRMRAYYGAKRYDDVLKDATFLLGSSSSEKTVVREARFLMAMSYLKKGDRDYAKPVFEDLASDVSDEFGAESKYLLVQDAFDHGDFMKVESLVKEFATAASDQRYWLAKSYIVLGDAYWEMEDLQQARITYDTLLEGYSPSGDDDDVLEQVRMRQKRLKPTRR